MSSTYQTKAGSWRDIAGHAPFVSFHFGLPTSPLALAFRDPSSACSAPSRTASSTCACSLGMPLPEGSKGEAGSGAGFGRPLHRSCRVFHVVPFRDMPSSFGITWVGAAGHTSGAAGSRALWAGPGPRARRPSGSPGVMPLSWRVTLSPVRGRVVGPSAPFLMRWCLQATSFSQAHGETHSCCLGCF